MTHSLNADPRLRRAVCLLTLAGALLATGRMGQVGWPTGTATPAGAGPRSMAGAILTPRLLDGPDGLLRPPATGRPAAPDAAARVRLQAAFGRMPLAFIENRGQLDPRVAYYVQGRDKRLYFTAAGVTFALSGPEREAGRKGGRGRETAFPPTGTASRQPARQRWVVKLDFVGANRYVRPRGEVPTPTCVSYFKGPRSAWQTGLPTFSQVAYRNLWPGIDLAYQGTVNRLKYEFVVRPGADPRRIRLAYRGATRVRLTAAGQLEVSTPAGGFQDDRPLAYQEIGGRRVPVHCAYALSPGAPHPRTGTSTQYHFRLGAYDPTRPLVIDPVVLVYCGYIGGGDGYYGDGGNGIAVDGDGNVYVAGSAGSTEATFPVALGPDLTYNDGHTDAFVAKVNAAGTGLDYCGYIGGSDTDEAHDVAIDSCGNAYIIGITYSSEATFPVSVGPDLTYNGFQDAFVARVNAVGTGLDYCGYIGGARSDEGWGIAVDGAQNAYVTGRTASSAATFPVAIGPDLTFNGEYDAFVAKVNPTGTRLDYCGYIGGADGAWGFGIAVNGDGNAYITGVTSSTEVTFPATVGPDLTHNGFSDAFIARVNAPGTGLDYCGYIGGNGIDVGSGIAVDSDGNAYVAGRTTSTEATFPVAIGPDLTFNGEYDAFVAKVNPTGTGLDYCGYIGGANYDAAHGIAVDAAGNTYVVGNTQSTEATFPVIGGPDLTFNGRYGYDRDVFVAPVRADGTALHYCGYIGGDSEDWATDIAVDGAGNAYVVGTTGSREATFPVVVGPDLTHDGYLFAFVAKINYASLALPMAPSSLTANIASLSQIDLSWTDNSANEIGFEVWRKLGNGNFALLRTVGPNETALADVGLAANTLYTYRVRAINAGGASAYSGEASAVIPVGGKLKIAPRALAFRRAAVGSQWTRNLVLRNVGKGTLAGKVAPLSDVFQVVSGGAYFTLAPKERKIVTVEFAPPEAGTFAATLGITSTDARRPSAGVPVKGTAR
ncbi:MAG: SBBP repeat-containing protein [Armatimonadetes bacterium]|nr:SBBP repeat-containing protein [Armatimonadota bacterium]